MSKGLSPRVKNEIARKLREYGTVDDRHHAPDPKDENFPQSWLDGRGSSANEPKIYDKDRDYGDTNFRKQDSGQEDLDEGISDLIGNQYKFTIGSGTTMNQIPNTKEYVIEQITHAISHYLFDWDFYYNWTDRTEQKEYGDIFKNDVLKPLLKNLDKTLKTYFIVDTDKKTVKWKLSYPVCTKFIDEFFRKNKHISNKLKQDYYGYRDEYAGVTLKESSKEDKNGFVDNATSSTAWLMGREGRKFKKATYDKDGTYDGENFVSKNSGQPDLDENTQIVSADYGGYDNSKFLYKAWRMSIEELETLIAKAKSDLKWLAASSSGVMGLFNKRDAGFVKSRISFANQIIKSKKKSPDYIPDHYR